MEVVLRCQVLFKYIQADDLASNNTALNVNWETALKMWDA